MTKALSIYLGSKCNMNCAYCHRESSESETGVSDKLLNYIKERKIYRIAFFGGEPTLYMVWVTGLLLVGNMTEALLRYEIH